MLGIATATYLSIEHGKDSVQIGHYARAIWLLDVPGSFLPVATAQRWRLAPAFDLVAQHASGPTPGLAMAYYFDRPRGRLSQGSRLVSSANRADLLNAAVTHYAYQYEEAADWYESARAWCARIGK